MKIKKIIRRIRTLSNRNLRGTKGMKSKRNRVNIEYYPVLNIGDTLGPAVVDAMLRRKDISPERRVRKTKHLLSVGSVLDFDLFDAAVWGTGILSRDARITLNRQRLQYRRRLDVRAVRGPETRRALLEAGYDCPEVYGDPAVLMPLVYPVREMPKKYKVSVIFHFRSCLNGEEKATSLHYSIDVGQEEIDRYQLHVIDPRTTDYAFFINEILASELIVSSALHGIILAETYGVPAVFLNLGMDAQLTKFRDWYLSTGRELKYCTSIAEALAGEIPEVPDLNLMRETLAGHFPYDLWEG